VPGASSVAALRQAVTLQLSADRQWAAVELSSDLPLAHALQASNFNGRAFFNIEFCVFHAHTLPEVRCCTQFLPPPFLHKDAIWRYDAYLIVLIRFSASISSSSSRK